MDPQVSSSFIPKKSLTPPAQGSAFGLLFIIVLFLFVASIVTAGAAWGYRWSMQNAIDQKNKQLLTYESTYDLPTIENLLRLSTRLTNARSIVQKHVAPSALFTFLSSETLATVVFNTFSYTLQNDGSAALKLDGVAQSFNDVALQSDQFAASKSLRDVIFSNIGVGLGGQVSFTVQARGVAPLLLYSSALQGGNTTPPPPPSATSTATTTSI